MSYQKIKAYDAVLLLAIAIAFVPAATVSGQDTTDYFRKNCLSCHTIGGGRLTGPDLKNVSDRKDRAWLISFMRDPQAMINSKDPYALKILEESRRVPMPALPGLTQERAEKLLDLIESESKLEKSQFQGIQISNKPFTDQDREAGRNIFLGTQRLEAGGAACISCHGMHDTPALGGGRLDPKLYDLTKVIEKLGGRKSLSAWLVAPSTPNMEPAFRDHPLTADEIHSLVAYFDASKREEKSDSASGQIAFLLAGLAGAAALVFMFDAIWKRRFHAVRRPLVDANSPRGH